MLKKIFSVGNEYENGIKTKVITILGIKIKFKIKSTEIFEKEVLSRLDQIEKKLSMVDNVWQFNNTKVYVPNYPIDYIQQSIVNKNEYYEQNVLEDLDEYIPNNAVVVDIGANIGNHTLYWLLSSSKNIKRVHSFEPVKSTFEILAKNVELNKLEDKVKLYNCGLCDESTHAKIKSYSADNIGGTNLEVGDGDIILKRLDDIDFNEEQIGFIKIDVETMELEVLKGGIKFLNKYKPLIFVESFDDYYSEVHKFLSQNNYECVKEYPDSNYLYKYKGN